MIYLATPYNHPDTSIRDLRYLWACKIVARLMSEGHRVISPIVHNHPLVKLGAPKGWDYWQGHDGEILEMCSAVWVVKMPGWETSIGVQAEIALANKLGKPVKYLEFEDDL
jgi:hypothetical protein